MDSWGKGGHTGREGAELLTAVDVPNYDLALSHKTTCGTCVRDMCFCVLLGINAMMCRYVLAKSDEILFMGCGTWYVPRSRFIHEWQCDALQGGCARRHDKLSIDTL
jgi:hypothetical protein